MDKNEKVTQNDSSKVAEKNYQPEDYKSDSELSSGLAMTHEQASDTLTEGTIDGKIDNVAGKDLELRRDKK